MTSKTKKITAIVQARMGSSRLPGKVLMPLGYTNVIAFLLDRLEKSKTIDEVLVATSTDRKNESLIKFLKTRDQLVFAGSELDVLGRYFFAAKHINAENIVRITGDCPLVDPSLIDEIVQAYLYHNLDYCSNVCPPSFPDGFDVEIFSFAALEKAFLSETEKFAREHVTTQFRNNSAYKKKNIKWHQDCSHIKLSVDTESDYLRVHDIVQTLINEGNFTWLDALNVYHAQKRNLDTTYPGNTLP